jgi:hypothetical protein
MTCRIVKDSFVTEPVRSPEVREAEYEFSVKLLLGFAIFAASSAPADAFQDYPLLLA